MIERIKKSLRIIEFILFSKVRSNDELVAQIFFIFLIATGLWAALVSLYVSIAKVKYIGLDWWALGLGVLISALLVWSLFNYFKSSKQVKEDIYKGFSRITFRGVLFGLITLSLFIGSRWDINVPFWLDEYLQFAIPHNVSISFESARQQQPPLDYFLSFFNFSIWGPSVTSARIYTYIYGALAFLSVALAFYSFRLNLILFIGLLTFVAFNNVAIWYNFEARPISVGIFYGVLSFYFYFKCFVRNQEKLLPLFLLSGVLLNVSLGLQPSVIFLNLFLITLIFGSNKIPRLKSLFWVSLPVVLTLPYILRVFWVSVGQNQFFTDVAKDPQQISQLIKNQVTDILNTKGALFLGSTMIWILQIVLGLCLFHLVLKIKNKIFVFSKLKRTLRFCTYIILSYVTYTLVLSFINWTVAPRYFIAIHITVLLALGAILGALQDLPKVPWLNKKRIISRSFIRFVFYGSIGFIGSEYMIKSIHNNKNSLAFTQSLRADWASAARKLHRAGHKSYTYVNLPFRRIGYHPLPSYGLQMHRPAGKEGTSEFNKYGIPCLIPDSQIQCNRVLVPERIEQVKKFDRIVFVLIMEFPYYNNFENNKIWRNLPENYEYFESNNLVLFVVPFNGNPELAIVDFYEEFIKLSPNSESNFFILEELFYYYHKNKKSQDMKRVLRRAKLLNYRKDLSPIYTNIPGINEDFSKYLKKMESLLNEG